MRLSPEALVLWLNSLPPEVVLVVDILVCHAAIMVMLRLFGPSGLFVYISLAVVGAGLQVLKATQFAIYTDPVALGTVLFASTYLCTDILTEYYGRSVARRGVWLGFSANILMSVVMTVGLGYRPVTPEEAGVDMAWAVPNQAHLSAMFLPQPIFLLAGLTSYLISQFTDVWIFLLIRWATRGRLLWLRASGSTAISTLLDNTVFSLLAWVVIPLLIGQQPIGFEPLIFTFILGTYFLRLAMAAIEAPFMYLARLCLPPEHPRRTGAAAIPAAAVALTGP